MTIDKLGGVGTFSSTQRLRRQVEFPDVNGSVEDKNVLVNYEVLQVSNGNALVWLQGAQPELPTASRGFGWIEPLTNNMAAGVDVSRLRSYIERRLHAHLQANPAGSFRG